MAQPQQQQPHQIQLLSESHLNQALGQIRQVPVFNGTTSELSSFIRRIEFIQSLYPTTDARQAHIMFSAIEMQIGGDAQRVSQLSAANTWIDLKEALIAEFKTQTPFEELLRRLYNTPFNGSLRKFIEELEEKCFIITNKLSLENNPFNNHIYTNGMNNTVKDVIIRKLPDRLYMQLARFDITTVSKLKQIAQQEGCYDSIWSDRAKSQNSQNKNNDQNKSSKSKNYSPNYNQVSSSTSQNQNYNNTNDNKKNNNNSQNIEQLYQEFKQKLDQAQLQNTTNYQTNQASSSAPNPAHKRQRPSSSGQSRMDTSENFHQNASDEEQEETRS